MRELSGGGGGKNYRLDAAAGALIGALDYYEGFRFRETVEVAVVFGRLGYRLRTDIEVTVPVSRSRTRVADAVIDIAAIPPATLRVLMRRQDGHAPGV